MTKKTPIRILLPIIVVKYKTGEGIAHESRLDVSCQWRKPHRKDEKHRFYVLVETKRKKALIEISLDTTMDVLLLNEFSSSPVKSVTSTGPAIIMECVESLDRGGRKGSSTRFDRFAEIQTQGKKLRDARFGSVLTTTSRGGCLLLCLRIGIFVKSGPGKFSLPHRLPHKNTVYTDCYSTVDKKTPFLDLNSGR